MKTDATLVELFVCLCAHACECVCTRSIWDVYFIWNSHLARKVDQGLEVRYDRCSRTSRPQTNFFPAPILSPFYLLRSPTSPTITYKLTYWWQVVWTDPWCAIAAAYCLKWQTICAKWHFVFCHSHKRTYAFTMLDLAEQCLHKIGLGVVMWITGLE